MSSWCLLPDLPALLPDLPELRGTVDDGLCCNDSDGTFSDATYEYGDDDDDDDVTFGVGAPPLPPPPAAANDPVDLYVRQMNEEAFSFMMTRAQQARIYAAHAARAPEYTPEAVFCFPGSRVRGPERPNILLPGPYSLASGQSGRDAEREDKRR